MHDETRDTYNEAADEVVALGNRILDDDEGNDSWDVASGLVAGAVQFWLYSRQPCDNPMCEDCADISTPERRLQKLLDEVRAHARDSDYFDAPNDMSFGTA